MRASDRFEKCLSDMYYDPNKFDPIPMHTPNSIILKMLDQLETNLMFMNMFRSILLQIRKRPNYITHKIPLIQKETYLI